MPDEGTLSSKREADLAMKGKVVVKNFFCSSPVQKLVRKAIKPLRASMHLEMVVGISSRLVWDEMSRLRSCTERRWERRMNIFW